MGNYRLPILGRAADPVSVGFVNIIALGVVNRKTAVPVAESGFPLVQGYQLIHVGTDTQVNTPVAGGAVGQQQELGDFLHGAVLNGDGIGQTDVKMIAIDHGYAPFCFATVNYFLTING